MKTTFRLLLRWSSPPHSSFSIRSWSSRSSSSSGPASTGRPSRSTTQTLTLIRSPLTSKTLYQRLVRKELSRTFPVRTLSGSTRLKKSGSSTDRCLPEVIRKLSSGCCRIKSSRSGATPPEMRSSASKTIQRHQS